jgi:ankyrin repeat protein
VILHSAVGTGAVSLPVVPTDLLQALYTGDAQKAIEIRESRDVDVLEAAALGELVTLRRLLEEDPDLVHAWSDDGFTPLHYAAFFGHEPAARLLIEYGADLEAVSTNEEFAPQARPLHSAVAGRTAGVARLLVEAGADVNAQQHGGYTPLMGAEQNGDRGLTEYLRAHGATG